MIRVILSGATGKVGQALLPAIEAADDLELAAAAAPSLGIGLDLALEQSPADVVVDFTAPEFAAEGCRLCIEAGVPLVLGTTGVDEGSLRRLGEDAAAAGVPLFHAANFAIGAVLMMRFAEEASRRLPAAEIVELHADTKRDAPSGTSRATAARMAGDVPIHSVRLPGLVAHQEVILGGPGETLTIRHDTTSREAFSPGVLLAVRTVRDLPPGLTVGLEILLARSA
ncbi:MAG TPA: dihydrodipicolinate reductase C-terminal domain-containing protein [Gaiellales bacterium]|nr:dihydrodipicolinate reductase C-terminal domain-containing protein [Gaiellales bacterium]